VSEIDLSAEVAMLTDRLDVKRKESKALSDMLVKRLNIVELLRDLGAEVDDHATIRVAPIGRHDGIVAVVFNDTRLELQSTIPHALWGEKYGSVVGFRGRLV
jgi:hypothetical protein